MPRRLNDSVDVKNAVSNSATGGALAGVAVDTTGFGRARFVFTFNDGSATTAAVSGNIGIWEASTSGATFTAIGSATLATVSSGAVSGQSLVAVIDIPTDPSNPWMKVSGNISSTSMRHNAVVELYSGISRPPTSSAQQIVTL